MVKPKTYNAQCIRVLSSVHGMVRKQSAAKKEKNSPANPDFFRLGLISSRLSPRHTHILGRCLCSVDFCRLERHVRFGKSQMETWRLSNPIPRLLARLWHDNTVISYQRLVPSTDLFK